MRGLVFYGRTGPFTRRMLAVVLGAESILVFFGALVARGIAIAGNNPVATAYLLVGTALAAACLVAAGLTRSAIGVTLGWLVQAAAFASALVVPLMAGVGLIFTTLWVACLVQGHKVDTAQARARGDAGPARAEEPDR